MQLLTTQDPMQAAHWLTQAKLLSYPTESVWGVGVDPMDPAAFEHLLKAKGRDADKGVILIASTPEQLDPLLNWSEAQREQALSLWSEANSCTDLKTAQALTLVVPASRRAPAWLKGAHQALAVRLTAHPLCQALCDAFGGPVVSTSANRSGEPAALSLAAAQVCFGERSCYLEGDTLGYAKPSRLIDLVTGAQLR